MDQYSEINPSLGYYTVGNQIHFNKIGALMATQGTDQHPEWHFNEHQFDSVDWSLEPDIHILELYRQRAQQLREQYDYLILYFSGGSDSHNVMRAFVDNGLLLDEIVSDHPESGLRHWTDTTKTLDAKNTQSEFHYTLKPLLNWVSTHSPQTRITYNDYFDDMIKIYQRSDDWFMKTREYLHPTAVVRYNRQKMPHIQRLCDQGKKIAFIYGIDKPKLAMINGGYYHYFLDILVNTTTWDLENYRDAKTEHFYWSPDLPLLQVKQSHLVVNWLNDPENRKFQPLLRWPPPKYTDDIAALRSIYDRAIRKPLYPLWDFNLFQVKKPSSTIFSEHDYWFFELHKSTAIYDAWYSGVKHLRNLIPEKWWQYNSQGSISGFVGFISKMRYIGPVK